MNNRTILLVEDNPSDIDLTRRALKKNRIANELIVIEDGQEALDYLFGQGVCAERDLERMPAVMLLDINLPRLSGLEILRSIRRNERTRRIPVVILTSSIEEQDLAASYDLGTNSYVRKPVDFVQFSEAVKNLGLYWLILNEPPPEMRLP